MADFKGNAAKSVIVRTFKYDGSEHRRWSAQISQIEGTLIILDAKFVEEIHHPLLGTVVPETVSVEYYWLDRWYNIFRFIQPTGELRNYYCNVNIPPIFHRNVLSYIDLDIDVLVAPDLSYTILDEDEYAANAARFNYPLEVRRRAEEALKQVIALIEEGGFPFNDLR
jgi:protein associated with RNAse G/E